MTGVFHAVSQFVRSARQLVAQKTRGHPLADPLPGRICLIGLELANVEY